MPTPTQAAGAAVFEPPSPTAAQPLRLTAGQRDLYIAAQQAESPATYHVCLVYRVDGTLDEGELRRRFARLLAAHPVLATRVVEQDGTWVCTTAERPPRLDVCPVPVDPDSDLAGRRVRRETLRPLDPALGPLLRVTLLRYGPDVADLVIAAHHLIVDEASLQVMTRWLLSGDEPVPARSFPSWAAAQGELPAERIRRADELRQELLGSDVAVDLGWGLPDHAATRQPTVAAVDVRLSEELWTTLGTVAAGLRITPYSLVLGAAALVLGRNSRVRHPVLAATVSRRGPRDAAAIGYFNSTVPLPLSLDGEPGNAEQSGQELSVADFLRRVHARAQRAYRDADLPLSAVLPPTARAGLPMVVVPCAPFPAFRTGACTATPRPDSGDSPAQFPLALYLHPDPRGGMRLLLRHRPTVIGAAAAARVCRQLASVLTAFAERPQAALEEVSTVTTEDLALVTRTGQGPRPAADATATIPGLFAARAAEGPERTALCCGADRLSYAELDDRSTALAHALLAAGVRPGDRVGVCLAPSVGLVVALLAVMKTGAAYVPLDPEYPRERLAFLIEDTAVALAVTDTDALDGFAGLTTLPPDAAPDEAARTADPLPVVSPDAVAYVIHTSGSTGRPKGVLIPHRNVAALLAGTTGAEGFAFGPADVWSFFHSFAFDFSVWEIWACLLTGGRLVVVERWTARDPQAFHALLAEERVTVLNQTPSAFSQLLGCEGFAAGSLAVRLLVFGGEPLDAALLLPWLDRYDEDTCRVVNMYGITETTVHCTWRTLTRADALTGTRSVGVPLPGWRLYVLDAAGRPVPPGVSGEIHVGGAGVAEGYLHRPELTAERFRPDHLAPARDTARRLYRTGDVGRWNADGDLEHLGRLDDQVKIRGHRIELGEIRQVLLDHPGVRAAAAVVHGASDPATARVDAYVVPAEPDPGAAALRGWLAERLPAHMVPATVTHLTHLPLTPNGKLDPGRLPPPARDTPPTPEDAATPGTGAHPESADAGRQALTAVWQDVLGVPVGPDDNFFELGGNSLLAVRLNTELRRSGFTASQLRDIFRNPTPRRLAAVIGPRAGASEKERT